MGVLLKSMEVLHRNRDRLCPYPSPPSTRESMGWGDGRCRDGCFLGDPWHPWPGRKEPVGGNSRGRPRPHQVELRVNPHLLYLYSAPLALMSFGGASPMSVPDPMIRTEQKLASSDVVGPSARNFSFRSLPLSSRLQISASQPTISRRSCTLTHLLPTPSVSCNTLTTRRLARPPTSSTPVSSGPPSKRPNGAHPGICFLVSNPQHKPPPPWITLATRVPMSS